MPSRFHPIEDGLWDDCKFDGQGDLPEAPGDTRGFFSFLCSNKAQRPAGIYRITNDELAAAYRWPIKRVITTLADLSRRGLVVRDGSWIFLPGYWKRQAHNDGLCKAARKTLESCSSSIICEAFIQHYPLHRQWLPNRLPTVRQPSNENAPTEQSNAEQSNAEEGSDRTPRVSAASDIPHQDSLDLTLKAILDECPNLSLVSTGVSAGFWDQVLGACEPYPLADSRWLGAKMRAWDTWFAGNPSRRSRDRKRLESRLMGWLTRDLEQIARQG